MTPEEMAEDFDAKQEEIDKAAAERDNSALGEYGLSIETVGPSD